MRERERGRQNERERERERDRMRDRMRDRDRQTDRENSELYYSRIEFLGNSLFLLSVLLLSYIDNTYQDY